MKNGSGLLSPALSSLRREGEEVADCPDDFAQAIPQWRDRVLAYGQQTCAPGKGREQFIRRYPTIEFLKVLAYGYPPSSDFGAIGRARWAWLGLVGLCWTLEFVKGPMPDWPSACGHRMRVAGFVRRAMEGATGVSGSGSSPRPSPRLARRGRIYHVAGYPNGVRAAFATATARQGKTVINSEKQPNFMKNDPETGGMSLIPDQKKFGLRLTGNVRSVEMIEHSFFV